MVGIEFIDVSKRYSTARDAPQVVDRVSFRIPQGTLTTLLGPSGCGKTTTLRMIAGLETPDSGRVLIDGQDVTALGPAQRNVSLVFQSYALFPHMGVLANVAYGLKMSGVAKAQITERARAMLETVGLHGMDARMPSELSGGQQQRVALARALALQPSVLLFDEPLSNLDARLRRSMREEIRALQQRLKLTVAYVTHDQSEALAVSDHILVMHQGRIAQHGEPSELYDRPRSEFVASFMGEAMLMQGHGDGAGFATIGPLRLPVDAGVPKGPITVAVRPDAWAVDPASDSGLAARLLKGTYLGNAMEYTFATELGEIFVVSLGVSHRLATGTAVSLRLPGHGISVVTNA